MTKHPAALRHFACFLYGVLSCAVWICLSWSSLTKLMMMEMSFFYVVQSFMFSLMTLQSLSHRKYFCIIYSWLMRWKEELATWNMFNFHFNSNITLPEKWNTNLGMGRKKNLLGRTPLVHCEGKLNCTVVCGVQEIWPDCGNAWDSKMNTFMT